MSTEHEHTEREEPSRHRLVDWLLRPKHLIAWGYVSTTVAALIETGTEIATSGNSPFRLSMLGATLATLGSTLTTHLYYLHRHR